MKKIFAIVLSALLCLSLFMVAGCGSAFDANYKETDAETMNAIVNQAYEAEEGTRINYAKGVKVALEMEMKMTANGKTENVSVKSNMVMTAVDDNLIMSGEIKANGDGENVDGKVYYSDGWLYANGTYKDNQIKMKQQKPIDAFIDEFSKDSTMFMDIQNAFEHVANIESIKYYSAVKDGNTYVKFAYEEVQMGKGEIYFIFDADFNLIGFKMEGSSKMDMGQFGSMESKMFISYEPYSGSVNLPSDLDTYEEGQF